MMLKILFKMKNEKRVSEWVKEREREREFKGHNWNHILRWSKLNLIVLDLYEACFKDKLVF